MTYEEAISELKDRYLGISGYVDKEQCEKANKALDMAIQALEKQIPQKPIRVDKNQVFDGNWKMICPSCGAKLVERVTTDISSYPIHYNMTKHCNCGQALAWDEDDNDGEIH